MKIKVVGAMACWCRVVVVGVNNIVDISVVVGKAVGGVVMSIRWSGGELAWGPS